MQINRIQTQSQTPQKPQSFGMIEIRRTANKAVVVLSTKAPRIFSVQGESEIIEPKAFQVARDLADLKRAFTFSENLSRNIKTIVEIIDKRMESLSTEGTELLCEAKALLIKPPVKTFYNNAKNEVTIGSEWE